MKDIDKEIESDRGIENDRDRERDTQKATYRHFETKRDGGERQRDRQRQVKRDVRGLVRARIVPSCTSTVFTV